MTPCPACNGDGHLLGTLGSAIWLRCRQCGWEYLVEDTSLEDLEAAAEVFDAITEDYHAT